MPHSIEVPGPTRISIIRLGWTFSTFLAISFILCVVFGFIVPDLRNLMPPSFFPGFSWEQPLTTALPGLVWSFAVGWYAAALFGVLYNGFGRLTGK
jgi:hypothetical protein